MTNQPHDDSCIPVPSQEEIRQRIRDDIENFQQEENPKPDKQNFLRILKLYESAWKKLAKL